MNIRSGNKGWVEGGWRRNWRPTLVSCLEIQGQRSPVGCGPWGRKEVDTPEQLSTAQHGTARWQSSLFDYCVKCCQIFSFSYMWSLENMQSI